MICRCGCRCTCHKVTDTHDIDIDYTSVDAGVIRNTGIDSFIEIMSLLSLQPFVGLSFQRLLWCPHALFLLPPSCGFWAVFHAVRHSLLLPASPSLFLCVSLVPPCRSTHAATPPRACCPVHVHVPQALPWVAPVFHSPTCLWVGPPSTPFLRCFITNLRLYLRLSPHGQPPAPSPLMPALVTWQVPRPETELLLLQVSPVVLPCIVLPDMGSCPSQRCMIYLSCPVLSASCRFLALPTHFLHKPRRDGC